MSEDRRAVPVAIDVSGGEAGSVPAPARDAAIARRRLALRIPDDEVVRPQAPAPEAAPRRDPVAPAPMADAPRREPVTPAPLPLDGAPLTPMRIITISEPPPPVVEVTSDLGEATTDVDVAPPDVDVAAPDTPRAVLALEVEEDVDVRFEDDPPTPRMPPVELADALVAEAAVTEPPKRPSDAPDEVAAEDVVTVEPPPALPAVSVMPPMRPRLASQPPVPPPALSKRPAIAAPVAPRPALVIVPPHVGSVPTGQADASGQRRKGRLWWEELFNDDYLRTSEKIADAQIAREATFVEDSLGVERGGAILDLGCGTGRHAIELARRGYEVVGFDLSLAMLARAGEEAQDRAAKLNFVQGDMREMSFEEQFDGVYCWNTTFGYFEEEKNAQVVDRVHRALKGGGQFLLDVVNRDFLIRQSPSLAWFEGDGCVCMDEMCVDFITSRMKVKRTMMLDDGRTREIEYSMRVYSLHELGKILHEHGFKVREVSGRLATPGVFFGNESPRAIILAEKR
jgi:SAM-dependent methyltransferase